MNNDDFTSTLLRKAADAERVADGARRDLATATANSGPYGFEALAGALNSMAHHAGRSRVYTLAADMAQGGVEATTIALRASEQILRPDDTWSGRSNDVRRAFHAGKCEAVEDVLALTARVTV